MRRHPSLPDRALEADELGRYTLVERLRKRTRWVAAKPSFSRRARLRVRSAMRCAPDLFGAGRTPPQAQRCSNEWKPPGVHRPCGRAGGCARSSTLRNAGRRRSGSSAPAARHAPGSAPHQPRTARAEQPLVAAGDEEVAAELRHRRRPRRRSRARRRRTAAHARVGAGSAFDVAPATSAIVAHAAASRPSPECTHVTATTRVSRRDRAPIEPATISLTRRGRRVVVERDTSRIAVPVLARGGRSASCVA